MNTAFSEKCRGAPTNLAGSKLNGCPSSGTETSISVITTAQPQGNVDDSTAMDGASSWIRIRLT
jgi:hypothetical protein